MNMSKMAGPIINRTVTSVIADHLRARILSGEFRGGESLLQDALAAEYNVSRIPLREALRQLEAEGLITSLPHRGATVSTLSIEEIKDNYEIRALLECDLLRCSLPTLEDKYVDEAELLMLNYADHLDEESREASWGALNWQFHSLLYSGVNRPKSVQILKSLHFGIGSFAHNLFVVENILEPVVQEHLAIIKLCRSHDVEAVVEATRRHILDWRGMVVADIEKQRQRQKEIDSNKVIS